MVKYLVYSYEAQVCKMFDTEQEARDFVNANPDKYFLGWDEDEADNID
jgi:hypothetical protein